MNGRTVTELGTRANPQRDRITIDGKPLRSAAPLAYIVLNKPVGVMTTLADPQGRPTVRDLLAGVRQRVFPVGRLDYHSAGLLLLTNDGELALRLTHPRYGVRKTYQVKVKGQPESAQLAALARGVRLPDGVTAPAYVRVIAARERKAWLEVTLAEGKNREVRRMCEAVGLPVEKLVRVALGPLKLGRLPVGAWRHLEPEEVGKLQAVARVPGGPRDFGAVPTLGRRPGAAAPVRSRPFADGGPTRSRSFAGAPPARSRSFAGAAARPRQFAAAAPRGAHQSVGRVPDGSRQTLAPTHPRGRRPVGTMLRGKRRSVGAGLAMNAAPNKSAGPSSAQPGDGRPDRRRTPRDRRPRRPG
jgi:23S rRNA pseudouridine2605 synthase